ncbi:MAG: hypothetical protein SGARI_004436 [Bacillariaceae sp.]
MDQQQQEEGQGKLETHQQEVQADAPDKPSASSTSLLPAGPSPTAKAFFDALDGMKNKKGENDGDTTSSKSLQNTPNYNNLPKHLVQKVQSAAWRGRHSQAPHYPMEIMGRSFHVQQVQRGEIDKTFGTDGEQAVVDLAKSNVQQAAEELRISGESSGANDGYHATQQQQSTTTTTTTAANDDTEATTTIIHGCPIHVCKYWWGDDEPPRISGGDSITSSGKHDYNLILVADCVLPKLYPIAPLVQAIDECLVLNDAVNDDNPQSISKQSLHRPCAILSYEHRWYPDYHPKQKFVELCHERNLQVETVSPDDMDPIYQTDDIEIWIVTRKC